MKITEQVIDLVLLRGSNFEEGKLRIYEHFKNNPKSGGADFLKEEYGIGGFSFTFLDETSFCSEDHGPKGIEIKTSEDNLLLSWSEVSKRIVGLLQQDKYFTPQEKNIYNLVTTKDIIVEETTDPFEQVFSVANTNKILAEGQLCMF